MNYFFTCIIGYALGSIPTSVIISKFILRDDIRQHGSGNPGSSNMIRTFGVKLGLLVLALDMLKGFMAALIGRWLLPGNIEAGMYYGAVAAVLGHNWSVFLGMKGGKGVATTVGASLVMATWPTLVGIAIFVVVLFSSKYFSLASLCCLGSVWVIVLFFNFANVALVMTCSLLTLLAVYRHADNITRLRAGTENRMSL